MLVTVVAFSDPGVELDVIYCPLDDIAVLEARDVGGVGQVVGVERARSEPTRDERERKQTLHGALFTRSAPP